MAVMSTGDYGFLTTGTVTILDSTHPITQGVHDFSIYSHGEWANGGMWPGAVQLGSYSAAATRASIAWREVGTGRSVYLGPIYFATFAGYANEPYYSDPDSRRLLKQAIEWAASGTVSSIAESPASGPAAPRFVLHEAAPNPLNGSTCISYTLERDAPVRLVVFNLAGREVARLVDGSQKAGNYSVTWTGTSRYGKLAPAGIYFVRLESGSNTATRKLVVQ